MNDQYNKLSQHFLIYYTALLYIGTYSRNALVYVVISLDYFIKHMKEDNTKHIC